MSQPGTIYLDYNATTPCDPAVVEAMLPYFSELYGNPANGYHLLGRMAHHAVETAREQVALLINARPSEIVFTAGATESNNLAILGLARAANDSNRRKIVTSVLEHKAILLPCEVLEDEGFEIVLLPSSHDGRVRLDAFEKAIDEQTLLVTVQMANNEIGTIQPISEIAQIARSRGALMHTDAAQAVGKIPVNVESLGVDMLSMSAHKFYGPKGVGALYLRSGTNLHHLTPLTFGGGQENGLRAGTTNVPAIVGMGKAAELSSELLAEESERITKLRTQLEQRLTKGIPGSTINGQNAPRLPNTISLTCPDVDADALLLNLPELMLGTGSACTSGAVEPSHVLQAIGLNRDAASSTIRACLGRFTTATDVEKASTLIVQAWKALSSFTVAS